MTVTGVETTGHEWDGIKELNKPLPRWWLLTFYACIVWAIGYWIVYPAWPTLTGYTKGMLGYSQRATVAGEIKAAQAGAGRHARAARQDAARRHRARTRICCASPWPAATRRSRPTARPATAAARRASPAIPTSTTTTGSGAAASRTSTRPSSSASAPSTRRRAPAQMPRYGLDKLLDDAQIDDVAEYVLSLSRQERRTRRPSSAAPTIFKEQCASCHGDDGKGKLEQGAPNLTDGIWLYGGSARPIVESIRTGRGGVMPAWAGRLDPRDAQGAGRLRAQPRRRQVATCGREGRMCCCGCDLARLTRRLRAICRIARTTLPRIRQINCRVRDVASHWRP